MIVNPNARPAIAPQPLLESDGPPQRYGASFSRDVVHNDRPAHAFGLSPVAGPVGAASIPVPSSNHTLVLILVYNARESS